MTGRSCWCLELFRKGQLTARNIDVVECSRLAPAAASREVASTAGLRCHASVPLYAGDRPLGVMNLAMRGWRRLARQELDLLTTIADQVGVAIERARLAEQSIEHARADGVASFARENCSIVVFTAYDADDDVFRAIRGGARGYLLKGSPAAEIAQAIRLVHAGESYLSPRIAAKLVRGVTQLRGRTGLLSARERGVLRLVAAGQSNRRIADTLSISERTVKFRVTSRNASVTCESRSPAAHRVWGLRWSPS
jgi:DNA-binding NarL/FixJ family response regulator